jgi:hypothetical protein
MQSAPSDLEDVDELEPQQLGSFAMGSFGYLRLLSCLGLMPA